MLCPSAPNMGPGSNPNIVLETFYQPLLIITKPEIQLYLIKHTGKKTFNFFLLLAFTQNAKNEIGPFVIAAAMCM